VDDEVLTLLRAEAKARMKPVSEIIRVAAGKWLVSHRRLRREQRNDKGRLIPEGLQRKVKRKRVRAPPGNGTALHGDAADV